jgi:hypothetical protein
MAVCWRAPTAGPVRIKLAVDRDGTVTATAATKGAAAQCAAGILAVWSLPGGPWKGEVDLAPGAAAAPALSQRIQRELASASASLRACQDRAPGKAGAVAIKLRINPDGSIAKDVKVTSSLGAALDGCVAQAVAAIRLAPLGTAAAVNYQLAIKFDGAAAGATSATSPGPAEAPTATVEGARAPAEIAAAVETARPALTPVPQAGHRQAGRGPLHDPRRRHDQEPGDQGVERAGDRRRLRQAGAGRPQAGDRQRRDQGRPAPAVLGARDDLGPSARYRGRAGRARRLWPGCAPGGANRG